MWWQDAWQSMQAAGGDPVWQATWEVVVGRVGKGGGGVKLPKAGKYAVVK